MPPKRKAEQEGEAGGSGSRTGTAKERRAKVQAALDLGFCTNAVHTVKEVADYAGADSDSARSVLEKGVKDGAMRRLKALRGVVNRGAARSAPGAMPAVGYTNVSTDPGVDE